MRYCGPRVSGKPPPPLPATPRQLVCGVACLCILVLLAATEFEVFQLLLLYVGHVTFPRRQADPCAPCGCGPLQEEGGRYCARDLGAQANRFQEPPLTPLGYRERLAGEFDALARPRMDKAQCVAVEAALGAVAATAGAAPAYASATRRTLFHLYSRPDLSPGGDLAPWQLTTIASILATQPPGSFQVVLWSPDAARPFPPSLRRLLAGAPGGALSYRVFDAAGEAAGTPFEGHFFLALRDRQAYSDSDIFRLLVLYKYGGVYLDMDVWLFRDLTPLLAFEWATEFSADGRAGHGVLFNNAIVHFLAGSPAITALVETALHRTTPRLRSWAFGPHLLDRVYLAGSGSGSGGAPAFRLMPWCFFHGMWSVGDVHSPDREVGDEEVVGGAPWRGSAIMEAAWGLHLHGLPGRRRAERGSIVEVYTRKFEQQVLGGGGAASL
jgi:hypothetical protein